MWQIAMSALVYSLPALLAFGAAGWSLDRALGFEFVRMGPSRWALRVATGLAALFLIALHPSVFALALAVAIGARLANRDVLRGSTAAPIDHADQVTFVALAVLACIACVRAATPIYWDEFVWLWKSRLELSGWGALREAALDPRAGVFPPGYPLLWSLMPAWLCWPLRRTPLEIATIWPLMVAMVIWFGVARETLRRLTSGDVGASAIALGAGGLLMATTPLMVVHMRSSYADLSVGLLASAIALMQLEASESEGLARISLAARVVVAILLVGVKDEGIAHLFAATMTSMVFAIAAHRFRAAREALMLLVLGAVPYLAWRVLMARHGVINTDHALGVCATSATLTLVRGLLAGMADRVTWGALWPIAFGAGVVAFIPRDRRLMPARPLVVTLIAQTAVLFVGLTCGPDRVRGFALGGSVFHRMLVQLAPGAIAMVVVVVARSVASNEPSALPVNSR